MKLARAPAIATLVVAFALLAPAAAAALDPGSTMKATATQGQAGDSATIENLRGSGEYLSQTGTSAQVGDYVSRHMPTASAPSAFGGSDIIEPVRARPDHLSPIGEVSPVTVTPGTGIDWTDVLIGVGIGLGAALLVAGGIYAMRHPPTWHPPTRPPAAVSR